MSKNDNSSYISEKDGWITIKGKGFEIEFRAGSDSVTYNKDKGALVLKNLPESLIKEIEDELAARSTD